MVKREKKTKKFGKTVKRTEKPDVSTDNLKVIWAFDNIDKDGFFGFDVERDDFYHKEVLSKIINYSNMTWSEIKRQTHDDGKSKHHILNFYGLSKEAQERYKFKFPSFVILAHFGVSSTQIQVVISREKCTKNVTQKIELVQNCKN